MKKVTVKVRKPSTGTDCRMSSAGTMISSALRLLAASVATTKVKTSEATMAANMRSVVRSAYSGRLRGIERDRLEREARRGRGDLARAMGQRHEAPAIRMKIARS